MLDATERAVYAARELGRRTGVESHDVLVILGSGLAGTADCLGVTEASVPLATLPFFPRYTATGHHAQAWSVPIGTKRVLVFAGRCHLYEGIEMDEVVHPLRTGMATGCSTVVLTAAVGGIREDLRAGSIVAVSDHLNLTGHSPLMGPEFVDMADAYTAELRNLALAAPGAAVASGVYAQVHGPEFETPAEVAMLRAMGADVVGMSMAIETIAARQAGCKVLGLAVVTNAAASAGGPTDIAGVEAVGAVAAPAVADIIRHVVVSLP